MNCVHGERSIISRSSVDFYICTNPFVNFRLIKFDCNNNKDCILLSFPKQWDMIESIDREKALSRTIHLHANSSFFFVVITTSFSISRT